MPYQALIDSAIAYWPLQETGGIQAIDATGNGHNGSLTGLNFSNDSVPGPTLWLPSALEATGTNLQRVTIPDHADLRGNKSFTLSAWARRQSNSDGYFVVITKAFSSSHRDYVLNWQQPSDDVGFATQSQGVGVSHSNAYDSYEWTFLTVTFDNSTYECNIYANATLLGNLVGTQPSAATTGEIEFFGPPFTNDNSSGREGRLAGVGFWDRVLSQNEIANLYAGPITSSESSPSIIGSPAVGKTIQLEAPIWEHYGYSQIEETSYLEVSDDGVSNWQLVQGTEHATDFTIPIAFEGKHLRLTAFAENQVGVSDRVSSSVLPIVNHPWIVSVVRGEIAMPGKTMGEISQEAGLDTGLAIPTGRE